MLRVRLELTEVLCGFEVQATSYLYMLAYDPQSSIDFTLEHVQADAAKFVDIGVVDFGKEAYFRRCHRIVIGQK